MIKTTVTGSPEKRRDGSLIFPKWEREIAEPLGLQIVGYDERQYLVDRLASD